MNVLGDGWSSRSDEPGFEWQRMRLAGEKLGASLYELAPGQRTWPYHYELGNEELLLVVSGWTTGSCSGSATRSTTAYAGRRGRPSPCAGPAGS